MKDAATWYGRAVFVGIAVNLFLSVPGMFWPNGVLDLVGSTPSNTPVWPAGSALLLTLLSLFYIPGAIDPHRYKQTALLTLFARFSGAMFFLVIWAGHFPLIGWIDLFFLIIQTPLLYLTYRRQP